MALRQLLGLGRVAPGGGGVYERLSIGCILVE
jgi:hypothetical protein